MKVARLEEWQPNVSTIVIPPPPSALVAKNQNLKKKNPGRDGKPSEMNWIELEW